MTSGQVTGIKGENPNVFVFYHTHPRKGVIDGK
jgi:hypothetical protein